MNDAELRNKWQKMLEYDNKKNDDFWKELTLEELQEFIDVGVNINAQWNHGFRAIHRVAEHNTKPAVIKKLLKAGANIHGVKPLGSPPLHWAAQSNESATVIQVLIDAGANINDKTEPVYRKREKFWGNTALHFAAKSNRNPCVIKKLLKAGADVSAINHHKKTAEELLQGNGKLTKSDKEIAKQLLQGKKNAWAWARCVVWWVTEKIGGF